MRMATVAVLLKIDEKLLDSALKEALKKLESAEGEVVLDFSAVHRIDPAALQAMEACARKAEEKAARIVLRGVNVDVYKVLKLVKLASRFSFVT